MSAKTSSKGATEEDFQPPFWLKNAHLMTISTALIPRGTAWRKQSVEKALIRVSPDSSLLAHCHIALDDPGRPTLILVHGLEGSSESFNILGLGERAARAGANVIRLNLRNCGETLHLTPTLYNAGLSQDLLAVVDWLIETKQLDNLFLVGFSLGGNLVLKAAAELGSRSNKVSAVCAVSPSVDLDACVSALEKGLGRFYEFNFLLSLKDKIVRKHKLFPQRFSLKELPKIKHIRQFDDIYTAPDGGYSNAEEYYRRASSLPLLKKIALPTLIITAQDDPIVPFKLFATVETQYVRLLAPKHGGHGAFIGWKSNSASMAGSSGPFWLDEQILDFCFANSKNVNDRTV